MIFPIFRKNLSFLRHKNAAFSNLVHFCSSFSSSSTSASKTLNPSPKSNPLTGYLISPCGFSSQRAASASRFISKVTSVEHANSVWHFFKRLGFTDTSIRKLVSRFPRVLSADIGKTLEPNLQTLREMGFTAAELERLISSNPRVLIDARAIPRLEFWQTFVGGSNRKDLVSVLTKNRGLLTLDIVSRIAPKMLLLKEHGLSKGDIVGLVKRGQGFITRSFETIETVLKSAKESGLNTKSPMFGQILWSLVIFSSDSLKAKMEIFKGYGWSEEELLAAFKKVSLFLHLSEKNIREKMEFLVGRVGCEPSYVALNPLLLSFSLEKRLRPRHHVMVVLKSNGIVGRVQLHNIMHLTEKKFVESVILPYKEQVPNIHEIYIAASGGQIAV